MKELVVHIPDLGGVEEATIIELLVKVGDTVKTNDAIMVLESDKASMEIPSTESGIVQKIMVVVGDKVSSGAPVMILANEQTEIDKAEKIDKVDKNTPVVDLVVPTTTVKTAATVTSTAAKATLPTTRDALIHAGPAVRKLAREFGIDLHLVKPSGPNERILKEDLQYYVKQIITSKSASLFDVPPMPDINFAEFGDTESIEIGRIKKITAINMHRNWVRIPHVTQFDEADISDLEIFRKSQTTVESSQKSGIKLTILPFIIKAVAMALRQFPQFNASIEPNGEKLVLKKYCHIGFAVDTEDGLLVPVIRDADQQSIVDLAQNIKQLSDKARTKKLLVDEMKGGCFTVSSLGGISGTAFTPIINAPEVAILGVSRASIKPVYIEGTLQPRTLLPLSLSYDHRIIDGAEAAKFTAFLSGVLADIEKLK